MAEGKKEVPMTEEEELYTKIKAWKKKYRSIYQMELAGETIVFRPLNRSEYKAMIENDEVDDIYERENEVTRAVTLYPDTDVLNELIEQYAGVADTISANAMACSGFSRKEPTKL